MRGRSGLGPVGGEGAGDLCRHFCQQGSGLESFGEGRSGLGFVGGDEQGIFAAISVSRDPDYNSLVGKDPDPDRYPDYNPSVREDPDYNLLVGKEQGIFVAISLSSTGTPLMTDS